MNLEINEIAHIGDNSMSDYEIPLSLGIKSYLYKESDYVINLRKSPILFCRVQCWIAHSCFGSKNSYKSLLLVYVNTIYELFI